MGIDQDYAEYWRATHGGKGAAGWFYIIQLVPDLKPERLKFGIARNAEQRLGGHRVSAPTASLLRTYPVVNDDEATIIAALVNDRCTRLTAEAYDVESVERVLGDAARLFAWCDGLDRDLYAQLLAYDRRAVAEYLRALQDPSDGYERVTRRGGRGLASGDAASRREALGDALASLRARRVPAA